MPDYYKAINITLTEEEFADLEKATAIRITETGTPVSVTRTAKTVLMEEVNRIIRRNEQ